MNRTMMGVAAALFLVACADSPTDSSGGRLTRQEAMAIADGVTQSGADATGSLRTTSHSDDVVIATPPTTVRLEHDSSHPCPQGGRIAIRLTATVIVDGQAGSFALDADGALTHQACAIVQDGVTLTVTGDPNITYSVQVATENDQPVGPFTSEAEGAFNWTASDNRSGRCVVNIMETTDLAARKRTVKGEVCGHTIKQTVTWS